MVSTGRMAVALCAALAFSAGMPVHAQQATGTMQVSVQAVTGCVIAATPMVFVVKPPYGNTRADSTSTINLKCTPNTDFTIDIDRGQNANGINRRMYNPTGNAYFGYDVYKDPPRSQVWGVGKSQNYANNSGPTGILAVTVYGRTEQLSKLKAGGYSDTLTITITF